MRRHSPKHGRPPRDSSAAVKHSNAMSHWLRAPSHTASPFLPRRVRPSAAVCEADSRQTSS